MSEGGFYSVYAICEKGKRENVVYVGCSYNIRKRIAQHYHNSNSKDLKEWMRCNEYEFYILQNCRRKTVALDRESYWICHFNDRGYKLFNKRILRGGASLMFRIRPSLKAKVNKMAEERGMTKSQLVIEWVEELVFNHSKKLKPS